MADESNEDADGKGDVTRVGSADQIVTSIVRGLYEGRYVTGQKLTEADLSRRYKVGRGSVREALCRLAAEGIVTVSLHKGASIRELTRQDARDILEVVESLSGLSARLAAERITYPDGERVLRDMLLSLSDIAREGDAYEFSRIRGRFYREIADIADNAELTRLISMVHPHPVRMQFRSVYAIHPERSIPEYERIIGAILARDGRKAEREMRRHVLRVARAIEQLPDRNFALDEPSVRLA